MSTEYFFSKLCFQLVPVMWDAASVSWACIQLRVVLDCHLMPGSSLLTYMPSRGICHTITEETRSS